MHIAEYEAYRRWIDKWLPQIVYGAAAGGGFVAAQDAAGSPAAGGVVLDPAKLPGADVVKAY